MKPDIWMPITIGDYLKDTTKLTARKHGVYFLLIMTYWIDGGLNDDLDELAIASRVAPGDSDLAYILDTYFIHGKGKYRHPRIDKEIASAKARTEASKENGKKGGRPRKKPRNNLDHNLDETYEKPRVNLGPNLEKSSSSSPSSSYISSKKKEEPAQALAVVTDAPKSLHKSIEAAFLSKVKQFTDYGKEGKAIKGLITKAEKWSPNDPETFIHQVIAKFYELRQKDKFFGGQPFTPSGLNSSGIFDRVMVHFENKAEQMDPEVLAYYRSQSA